MVMDVQLGRKFFFRKFTLQDVELGRQFFFRKFTLHIKEHRDISRLTPEIIKLELSKITVTIRLVSFPQMRIKKFSFMSFCFFS